MIEEYLSLRDAVTGRARYMGNLLRQKRHHGCFGHEVGIATPYITGSSPESVDIAVGHSFSGAVGIIRVPVSLFENGSDTDITRWVVEQNAQYDRLLTDQIIGTVQTKKNEQLQIMRELMHMYQAEAAAELHG